MPPSTPDAVELYARAVVAGEIVAGPPVRKACRRHLDDLDRGGARGLVWNREKAERALRFFERVLCLSEDVPFLLEPFQRFIVGSLFGWYRASGTRRFRTAYVEIGKGNGKTPLGAGIGLKGLVDEEEEAPEIYSAATSRDQAVIAFDDADRMVRHSPLLRDRVQQLARCLAIESRDAVMRPLSSEHRQLDGKRPYIAILDEIHEHPSPLVVNKIRAGTKRRLNALIFEITNSGFDRKSICWQHHEYSLRVLDGVAIDDSWFAYVCALDEGDEPLDDRSCWLKANPGLGTILPQQYLEEQVREAKGMPANENIVRRLNFCQWTEQAQLWMPMVRWDACDGAVVLEQLVGRPCFVGLDLSSSIDYTGLLFEFPPYGDDDLTRLLGFAFIPAERLAWRAGRDHVPLDLWVRQGHVIPTPGNVVDQDAIKLKLKEIASKVRVIEVCYDRWGTSKLSVELANEGFTVVPVGQGFQSMSPAMKDAEALVLSRGIAHGGNPVFRWMVSNTAAQQDPAGNLKPDREKSADRIDLFSAWMTAHARAMVVPISSGQSVYETREVMVVG